MWSEQFLCTTTTGSNIATPHVGPGIILDHKGLQSSRSCWKKEKKGKVCSGIRIQIVVNGKTCVSQCQLCLLHWEYQQNHQQQLSHQRFKENCKMVLSTLATKSIRIINKPLASSFKSIQPQFQRVYNFTSIVSKLTVESYHTRSHFVIGSGSSGDMTGDTKLSFLSERYQQQFHEGRSTI